MLTLRTPKGAGNPQPQNQVPRIYPRNLFIHSVEPDVCHEVERFFAFIVVRYDSNFGEHLKGKRSRYVLVFDMNCMKHNQESFDVPTHCNNLN